MKVVPKISNLKNLNRISMPAFLTPFLSLYRDIGADRSTLKPHFTPSNYTPKWHRAFPFFLSFPSRSPLARFLFGFSPIPGIFSRGSSIRLHSSHRKRGSFESLLSFLVFHGLMLPDQRFVGRIRIYLRTSQDARDTHDRY